MPAIEFPPSPDPGEVFVSGAKSWRWDEVRGAWMVNRATETARSVQTLTADQGAPNQFEVVVTGTLTDSLGSPVDTPLTLFRNGSANGYSKWTDADDTISVSWAPADSVYPDRWVVDLGLYVGATAESTATTPNGLAFTPEGAGSGSGTLTIEPLPAAYTGQECRAGDGPYSWYKWNGSSWSDTYSATSAFHDPNITGLTGGTAADLDGLDVDTPDAGRLQAVTTAAGTLSFYILEASTDGGSSPGVIAPVNGNDVRWKLYDLQVGNYLSALTGLFIAGPAAKSEITSYASTARLNALPDMSGWITVADSSVAAPVTTPPAPGMLFVETAGDVIYVSVDASSAADWKAVAQLGATQTFSGDNTFSGQTELTGQAATNSTSAMTRDLTDTRYGAAFSAKTATASSTALSGTTLGTVLTLTLSPTTPTAAPGGASTHYELRGVIRATSAASGGGVKVGFSTSGGTIYDFQLGRITAVALLNGTRVDVTPASLSYPFYVFEVPHASFSDAEWAGGILIHFEGIIASATSVLRVSAAKQAATGGNSTIEDISYCRLTGL